MNGNHAPVHLDRRDPPGRHAPQVEDREAEGRRQERRLQVHADHHAEPHHVDIEDPRRRGDQRDDDEGDLEEVDEEPEDEDREIRDDQQADLAARQAGQQVLDPDVAVQAPEHEREGGRADEQEDDHRGQLRRRVHRLLDCLHRQPPARQRQDDGADGAQGPRLGRRRDTGEDAAQNDQDQDHGRQHDNGHLARQRGAVEGPLLGRQAPARPQASRSRHR